MPQLKESAAMRPWHFSYIHPLLALVQLQSHTKLWPEFQHQDSSWLYPLARCKSSTYAHANTEFKKIPDVDSLSDFVHTSRRQRTAEPSMARLPYFAGGLGMWCAMSLLTKWCSTSSAFPRISRPIRGAVWHPPCACSGSAVLRG